MKYNRTKAFLTLDAALAFCEGVEFVNDSALTVIGIRRQLGGDHEVLMLDTDLADGADYRMRRVAVSSLVNPR
jgi:hypothetical protein